jgi:hypothetical protein
MGARGNGQCSPTRRTSVQISRSWLDPRDPRDATIVCAGNDDGMVGLVWDEETGWRRGTFVDGRPGQRTVLADAAYVGGGLLPAPMELANDIRSLRTRPHHIYRSPSDIRDGLDDALRSSSMA